MPAKSSQLHFVHFQPQSAPNRRAQHRIRAHVAREYRRRQRLEAVKDHEAKKGGQPKQEGFGNELCQLPRKVLWVDPFDATCVTLSFQEQHLLHYFFTNIGPLMLPTCPTGDQSQTWHSLWLREAIQSPIALAATLAHVSFYKDAIEGARAGGAASLQLNLHALALLQDELQSKGDEAVSDAVLGSVCCLLANAVLSGDGATMQVHMLALRDMNSKRAAANKPVRKLWLLQTMTWGNTPVHIHLHDMQLRPESARAALDAGVVFNALRASKPLFEECQVLKSMYIDLAVNRAESSYAERANAYHELRSEYESRLHELYSGQRDIVTSPESDLQSLIAAALLMFALCQLRAFGRNSLAMVKLSRQMTDGVAAVLSAPTALDPVLISVESSRLLLWISAMAARSISNPDQAQKLEDCMVQLMIALQYSSRAEIDGCCARFAWHPTLWTPPLEHALARMAVTDVSSSQSAELLCHPS